MSRKGGVGKTTISFALGSTFAELRGDRVIAVDANPDAGNLAHRVALPSERTITDVLHDADEITSYAQLRTYTSQADESRLEVLASDDDPRIGMALGRDDYHRLIGLLDRFYNLIVIDTGTGILDSANQGLLTDADQLVLVLRPGIDGGRAAALTLDWLEEHGAVVLSDRPSSSSTRSARVSERRSRRSSSTSSNGAGRSSSCRGTPPSRWVRWPGSRTSTPRHAAVWSRWQPLSRMVSERAGQNDEAPSTSGGGAVGVCPGVGGRSRVERRPALQPRRHGRGGRHVRTPRGDGRVIRQRAAGRPLGVVGRVGGRQHQLRRKDSAATSLGIVYANGIGVTQLDNLAGSTTVGRAGCRSAALSVQVVVVRRPGSIIANNRAVAVDAECVECHSSALAYQFVAVVPKGGTLDRQAVAELRAWVDDQAAQLRAGAGQRSLKAQTPPTADVEAKLRGALGSVSSLTTDVDIQLRESAQGSTGSGGEGGGAQVTAAKCGTVKAMSPRSPE